MQTEYDHPCAQTDRQTECQHRSIHETAERAEIMAVNHIADRIDIRHTRNKIEHA